MDYAHQAARLMEKSFVEDVAAGACLAFNPHPSDQPSYVPIDLHALACDWMAAIADMNRAWNVVADVDAAETAAEWMTKTMPARKVG